MNSKRIYQIGFFILILLNAVLIYLLIAQPDRPPRSERPPRGSIIEKISARLVLTEAQEAAYREMAKQHGHQMRNLDKDHRALISAYFQSFDKNPSSSDSIKNEILKIESDKLQHNFDHFKELKSILNEEQKNRFELIINDILIVLANDRNNRRPPGRGD